MVTYRDAGMARAKISTAPNLIAERIAFNTEQNHMYALHDVLGNYVVFSYNAPVLSISADNKIWATKGYLYKGHRAVLSAFIDRAENH